MLLSVTILLCLSSVLSIPSEFFAVDPPSEEVDKCIHAQKNTAHEVENCSDVLVAKVDGIIKSNMDLLKTNPEALPDSSKKIICCGWYTWELCALKVVGTTSRCHLLYEDYLKKVGKSEGASRELGFPAPGISFDKLCVKFPKESTTCA